MPMSANVRGIAFLAFVLVQFPALAVEPVKLQRLKVPSPPWPAGDERGMANQIGPATLQRCAWHVGEAGARTYPGPRTRSTARRSTRAQKGAAGAEVRPVAIGVPVAGPKKR